MKVGILTYHFSDNYGALFQAYALRKWLCDRGVVADFVNYQPTYVEEGGKFDRPWKPSLWRKNATILYMRQAHLRRKFFNDRAQHDAFEQFRAEHLGVSGPRLRSANALAPNIAEYDLLICGSDQIWNPSIQRGLDPVYFLDIPGSIGLHKVAYAPSFGRAVIDPGHHAELKRLVGGLNAVSVREASGLNILETAGMARETASVVPDPTILLGKFDELIEDGCAIDNSVFCYALRTDEVIREVAVAAAYRTGGRLFAPRNSHQRWRDIGEGVVPGPVEWLRMLARAKVVVSNSFHGIALSVVLNKPFIAVALPGKRAGMNARAMNLLTFSGLTDRLIDGTNRDRINELIDTPIDWTSVNARLSSARSDAEAYLAFEIAAARANRSLRPNETVDS